MPALRNVYILKTCHPYPLHLIFVLVILCMYFSTVNTDIGTSPPSGVTAVQTGPTSIRVTWSPSSDATGYRIDYDSSGGDRGSVTVSCGSTDMETLTGLQNGDTYTISIVALSQLLPSESVLAMDVGLGRSEHAVTITLCKS